MPWWINVLFTNKSEKVMVDGTPLRMTVFFQLFNVSFHQQAYVHIMHSYKKASEQAAGYLSEVLCSHTWTISEWYLSKTKRQADMLWSCLQYRTDLAQYKASSTIWRVHKVGWNNLLRIKYRQWWQSGLTVHRSIKHGSSWALSQAMIFIKVRHNTT